MDGNNRTIVIDVDNITGLMYSFEYAILSFTLDYHTQVLYWVFGGDGGLGISLRSSNVDGTNQQIILQLSHHYYYYYLDHYPPGLTVHKETLLVSSSGIYVVYSVNLKLGTNKNFTTFLNSSVLCGYDYYQLKVTKQPSGNHKLYLYTQMHL